VGPRGSNSRAACGQGRALSTSPGERSADNSPYQEDDETGRGQDQEGAQSSLDWAVYGTLTPFLWRDRSRTATVSGDEDATAARVRAGDRRCFGGGPVVTTSGSACGTASTQPRHGTTSAQSSLPARAGDASDIRTRRVPAIPGTVGSLSAAIRQLRRWRAFIAYARTLHPSEAFLLKRPFWHDLLEEERSIDCKRRLEDRRAAEGSPACTPPSVSAKSASFLGAPPRRADGGLAAVAHLVDR